VTSKRIIRVFPRRTKATPDDDLAFVGDPPLIRPEADEVHVSCTFTWDLVEATRLVMAWSPYYRTKLGGPACGSMPYDFVPGRFLKPGYVITSRGCPNQCWFCLVPRREGPLRTLPIRAGCDVLDNNLLACPRDHVEAVFDMLAEQSRRVRFTGGFDVDLVQPWHIERLADLRIDTIFIALDQFYNAGNWERAVEMLLPVCWQRRLCSYVLCGWKGDTVAHAEARLKFVQRHEVTPFPMYYQAVGQKRIVPDAWRKLVRTWSRPHAAYSTAPAASERGLL